jgi:hypothetical protein
LDQFQAQRGFTIDRKLGQTRERDFRFKFHNRSSRYGNNWLRRKGYHGKISL